MKNEKEIQREITSPLVSIVTPVYNGEKFLAECIESVLDQTYENWEYIILNNCSTDNTLQIAEKYAAKDERIEVKTNDIFLKQIPNWNESLRNISPKSKYCKVVHADDLILPECLEKMVARAEENPSAGIISAYRFMGSKIRGVRGEGLSHKITFMSGKEAGRTVLLTSLFLFGSPSTILYRSDLIREKESFYNPSVIHADTDVCFDLLQRSDFGFVHQILSFTRLHDQSTTMFTEYYDTHNLFDIYAVKEYGEYYLTSQEYDDLLSKKIRHHHDRLIQLMLNGRGKKVWKYHKERLGRMGVTLNSYYLFKAFLFKVVKIKPILRWIYKTLQKLSKSKTDNSIIEEKKQNTASVNS